MITTVDGNKIRINDRDPMEVRGFTLHPDGKTFVQDFLPCRHRDMKVCSTCKANGKSKKRPSCKLKRINSCLICVGCSERDSSSRNV